MNRALNSRSVGRREIHRQQRVITWFKQVLNYDGLDPWQGHGGSCVKEERWIVWLNRQNHSDKITSMALFEFGRVVALGGGTTLCDVNRKVSELHCDAMKAPPPFPSLLLFVHTLQTLASYAQTH